MRAESETDEQLWESAEGMAAATLGWGALLGAEAGVLVSLGSYPFPLGNGHTGLGEMSARERK